MAIKIGGETVISDTKKIGRTSSGDGRRTRFGDTDFTDFHPAIETLGASDGINLGGSTGGGTSLYTCTLTSNKAFYKAPSGAIDVGEYGTQVTVFLDRSASLYTPTFSTQFTFTTGGQTPSFGSDRYWTISMTAWWDGNIRCTMVPFDAQSTPSSSFSNFGGPLGNLQWNNQQNSYGSGTPWAACGISFVHNAANNRVTVVTSGGDSRNGTTQQTVYANYTGLTNITSVEVQYNAGTQQCSGSNCGSNSGQTYGPLPTDDGKASGTYYDCSSSSVFFGWSSEVDSNSGSDSQTTAAFNTSDPDFRIKIVCSEGTFYSTTNVGSGVNLFTNYGPTAGIGGGL